MAWAATLPSSRTNAMKPDSEEQQKREYEQSGMYPKDGKPFRLVALLLGLTGVVVFLAVSAAVLNFILI